MNKPKQLSLFATRTYHTAVRDIKEGICAAISDANLSKEEALDLVNEFAYRFGVRLDKGSGKKLSFSTWEKWTNPHDETRVPPAKALPVICAALGSIKPLAPLVELAGAKLVDEQDGRMLAWARAYHQAKEAKQKVKSLEDKL